MNSYYELASLMRRAIRRRGDGIVRSYFFLQLRHVQMTLIQRCDLAP